MLFYMLDLQNFFLISDTEFISVRTEFSVSSTQWCSWQSSSAAEHGARNFHMKPCMFTWAKIGSPFEIIMLPEYSKVSSYHLTSTKFPITT